MLYLELSQDELVINLSLHNVMQVGKNKRKSVCYQSRCLRVDLLSFSVPEHIPIVLANEINAEPPCLILSSLRISSSQIVGTHSRRIDQNSNF